MTLPDLVAFLRLAKENGYTLPQVSFQLTNTGKGVEVTFSGDRNDSGAGRVRHRLTCDIAEQDEGLHDPFEYVFDQFQVLGFAPPKPAEPAPNGADDPH